jgi:DNA-binding CsgD family transcriptional regulator/predicted ester cyclase
MDTEDAFFAGLTPKELVILRRLVAHGTYAQIAAELFLSVQTVKTHIAHVYAKLGVTNRAAAVARARDLGLLQADADDDDSPFGVTAHAVKEYWSEYVLAIKTRDWPRYAKLHRADAFWTGPLATCHGIDAMVQRNQEIVAAIPDWDPELVNVTVDRERNRAMVEFEQSGTHLGDLRAPNGMMLPATGRSFRFVSMNVLTFENDGLVSQIVIYWDFLEVMDNLGLRTELGAS